MGYLTTQVTVSRAPWLQIFEHPTLSAIIKRFIRWNIVHLEIKQITDWRCKNKQITNWRCKSKTCEPLSGEGGRTVWSQQNKMLDTVTAWMSCFIANQHEQGFNSPNYTCGRTEFSITLLHLSPAGSKGQSIRWIQWRDLLPHLLLILANHSTGYARCPTFWLPGKAPDESQVRLGLPLCLYCKDDIGLYSNIDVTSQIEPAS